MHKKPKFRVFQNTELDELGNYSGWNRYSYYRVNNWPGLRLNLTFIDSVIA